ncbi:MAG: thioredoxin domain-containing protein, partial [Nanoarchaeota archaeon]|nr:thioredoxin domain-containing protein [Nanoarchaeota archaeon]
MEEETKQKKDRILPVSILVAGVLISVSIIYGAGKKSFESKKGALGNETASPERMKEVSGDDHVRGDKNAPVVVVEFSDLECPFCKSFHETMKTVLQNYEGEVAWVYRHFPLDRLHPKARKEAEASECAAELGGNDAFWAYVDEL